MRIANILATLRRTSFLKTLSLALCLVLLGACRAGSEAEGSQTFSGERAYQDVLHQLSLGPRIPGQGGHREVITWIRSELVESGWQVEFQKTEYLGQEIINILGSREEGTEYILIGAHYDSRILADRDPELENQGRAVPGANDGASGVALLLELARVLPQDLPVPVKLVFFDAEDNGGIEGWEWILGSRAFVRDLSNPPQIAVIVDMIGDEDLALFYEKNSSAAIMEQIWDQAHQLGYQEVFIKEYKHSILDDHIPFLEAGLLAVDIIDIDYPYWHTTGDTADKVSPDSLEMVGSTLQAWILAQP